MKRISFQLKVAICFGMVSFLIIVVGLRGVDTAYTGVSIFGYYMHRVFPLPGRLVSFLFINTPLYEFVAVLGNVACYGAVGFVIGDAIEGFRNKRNK